MKTAENIVQMIFSTEIHGIMFPSCFTFEIISIVAKITCILLSESDIRLEYGMCDAWKF